jgi:hypothetical protein
VSYGRAAGSAYRFQRSPRHSGLVLVAASVMDVLKSRHWQGMVAAADTYRALGARAGFREASIAKGRQTYLTALFRARSEGSVEGVLRTAERFAELGRRAVDPRRAAGRGQLARSADGGYVRSFTECWAADAQGSTTGG